MKFLDKLGSKKEILKFAFLMFLATALVLLLPHIDIANARELLPLSDDAWKEYRSSISAPPKAQDGIETTKTLVFSALGYAKVLIAVIGILFITLQGYRLVTSTGDEEAVTKAKRGITYSLIAFVIISMSQDLAKIFDFENTTVLSSPQDILSRVRIFDRQVEVAITFIKYIIGSFATLMIVKAGLKLVTAGADEEEVTKQRKAIMYSISGLLLIYIGDIAINKVFYKIDKDRYSGINGAQAGIDVGEGVDQIVGVTNLIVSFVGPIALLMLIAGAVMYATAGGNEENLERAKRVVVMTVLGIVIMYGAFALVSTVLAGRLEDVGALLAE